MFLEYCTYIVESVLILTPAAFQIKYLKMEKKLYYVRAYRKERIEIILQ
jgi:hypothetical protein